MAIPHILLFRSFVLADFHTLLATGMKLTSGRRIRRGRNASFQNDSAHLSLRIRNRNRGEERLRIGVKRIGKEILRIAELHNISKIHNTDRIGNMFHYGKVMGDKEIRQFELLLQILQKVNYLCLNDTSSAETGSSQTTNSGFKAKALAIQILCLCPPENSCG